MARRCWRNSARSYAPKYWRYTYDFAGSEKLLSFGVWPDVSLKEAREKHLAARKLLAQGVDPSAARKTAKEVSAVADDNFEAVAREFLDIKRAEWERAACDEMDRASAEG